MRREGKDGRTIILNGCLFPPVMDDKPRLVGWKLDYATLLLGADTLVGGDIGSPKGGDHVFVDCWTSPYALPPIYYDDRAVALRKLHGVRPDTPLDLVASFCKAYDLNALAGRVIGQIASFAPDRADYILHNVRAAIVIAETMRAISEKRELPSYAERRRAATWRDEMTVDETVLGETREELRMHLSRAGFEVSPSRPLREAYLAWLNTQRCIPPEHVEAQARETIDDLLRMTRNAIFSKLDFSIDGSPHLDDVAFDGIDFSVVSKEWFTMSMAYQGGEQDGKPALRARYEYNGDHPITPLLLRFLVGHEAVPGHYIDRAIADLLYRSSKVGFEMTIGTMCSADVVRAEGWGNVALEALYGGRDAAIDALGSDYAICATNHDLQDIAKHDVSYRHQVLGQDLDAIKRFVAEDCAQHDSIVKKMSGAWATDPICGPMYGPAYYLGTRVMREAIHQHGALAVARASLHLNGAADIVTLPRKLNGAR